MSNELYNLWGQQGVPTAQHNAPSLSMPTPGAAPQTQGLDLASQFSQLAMGQPAVNAGGAGGFSPSLWQRAVGWTDPNTKVKTGGFAMPLLQAGQGIAATYLGMKQYGLAKDQFKEDKRRWNINYENQRKDINRRLEDRARARHSMNSKRYQSVSEYMDKHGV